MLTEDTDTLTHADAPHRGNRTARRVPRAFVTLYDSHMKLFFAGFYVCGPNLRNTKNALSRSCVVSGTEQKKPLPYVHGWCKRRLKD
jgi:hypothetical protein